MRYFIAILLGILLICHFSMNNANPDARQKILDKYGGKYSEEIGEGTNNGIPETIFNLGLKKSEIVKNYSTNLCWIPASNIAYLFYTNFKNADSGQNAKVKVKVKIELENEQLEYFVYTETELKKIKELTPIYKTLVKKISEKNYEGILSSLKINMDLEDIKDLCYANDTAFGKISETEYLGFAFVKNEDNNQTFVKLTGTNLRGVKNTPFSVFINMETNVIENFVFEF